MHNKPLLKLFLFLLAASAASAVNSMGTQQYLLAMAAMHAHDVPVASPAARQKPAQLVHGIDVVYANVNGKPVHGYFSVPVNHTGALPGIIVIHEWWGLNDNIRSMADQLAGQGYAALAVDLYGGKTAADPAQARNLMSAVFKDPEMARDNLRQAYAYLHEREHAPRIGVIGWCFGGGWSLQTALMFPEQINAAVMYYGEPVDDVKQLSKLKMPLMGFFGEQDQGITVKDVQAFEKALRAAKVKAEIHEYPDAGHAFANPSGERYRPVAAADAWKRTLAFFARYLKGV
ncbi:MAG: dienelactone hydrolase family protein [Gammaproteobacteria bacterium]|nr:dienelactone hydrolase family protein [Gammaproteobacteria bacterium]MDE2346520.1 dienelactone hydrolase family protein [Gammaproteobacteria bacterium]